MTPRAWLVWSVAAITVALSTTNPVYRGLVALAAAAVLVTWAPPGRRFKGLAYMLLFAAGLAMLINLLASHTGEHVFARIPEWLPIVGPVLGGPLTLESLAYGTDLGLGLAAALLAVAPLSMVLEAHDVVDAMPAALERTGIAVATSLNLVGGFGRTFAEVRDAQTMRGWQPRGIRSWNEVLVPTLLTAIEDSVRLAEAMEARAFGAGRRTSFASAPTDRWSGLVAVLSAAAAVAFVAARFVGVPMDWYPYPTPALPPIEPLLVVACLVLALPALRGRR